jgi:hypothetical protein
VSGLFKFRINFWKYDSYRHLAALRGTGPWQGLVSGRTATMIGPTSFWLLKLTSWIAYSVQWRAPGWMPVVRFPAGARFSLYGIQTGSGAQPASYRMGIWGCFPRRVKLPGRDADHILLMPRWRIVELYIHSPIHLLYEENFKNLLRFKSCASSAYSALWPWQVFWTRNFKFTLRWARISPFILLPILKGNVSWLTRSLCCLHARVSGSIMSAFQRVWLLPQIVVMKVTLLDITSSLYFLITYLSICLSVYSPLLDLGQFFSFLILYTVGGTPWTGNQPVARPLPTHRTTQTQITADKPPFFERESNPRSQCLSGRRPFMPQTARPLWSALNTLRSVITK